MAIWRFQNESSIFRWLKILALCVESFHLIKNAQLIILCATLHFHLLVTLCQSLFGCSGRLEGFIQICVWVVEAFWGVADGVYVHHSGGRSELNLPVNTFQFSSKGQTLPQKTSASSPTNGWTHVQEAQRTGAGLSSNVVWSPFRFLTDDPILFSCSLPWTTGRKSQ